jgi:light-regulated signal transduction histidine kinase (bacteriophytochrome)
MEKSLNFLPFKKTLLTRNSWKLKEDLVELSLKTNKELEDYAQIVSHDLKSPLQYTFFTFMDKRG